MEKKFEFRGSHVHYTVTGEGYPVMLVHGFAEDGSVWNEQVNFLQHHCLVVIPDLPGSGKSEMLTKTNVGIEDYAACLHALLQIENIPVCIILGHSMGGYVTLAFAKNFPQQLSGFGLVHSTAFADTEEKKKARKKGIQLIDEYGSYSFVKNSTPNLFSAAYKKENPRPVAQLIEQGYNFKKEALIQYYTAMMNRPDYTEVLRNSSVPVVFVVGSEDVAAPMEDLLQQVHLPKVSYFNLIQGVGHMGFWEKAPEVNQYLLNFIKAITHF